MTELTLLLSTFIFTLTVASLVFKLAIQPVLRDSIRFKLFAERDRLRQIAIDRVIDEDGFAFRHIEMMLNCMIVGVDEFDIRTVAERSRQKLDRRVNQKIESDLARFSNEATDELKQIEARSLRWMTLALGYNTPTILLVCVGAVWARKCTNFIKQKQRNYWYSFGDHKGFNSPNRLAGI